jgi:hypothetical protein
MYVIQYDREGSPKKSDLSFATRESAMKAWDKFCDKAIGGDVLTLKHPKGSVISRYAPAKDEDRGVA